jgi:hypothetical protein
MQQLDMSGAGGAQQPQPPLPMQQAAFPAAPQPSTQAAERPASPMQTGDSPPSAELSIPPSPVGQGAAPQPPPQQQLANGEPPPQGLHHLTRHWLPEEVRGEAVLQRLGAPDVRAAEQMIRWVLAFAECRICWVQTRARGLVGAGAAHVA